MPDQPNQPETTDNQTPSGCPRCGASYSRSPNPEHYGGVRFDDFVCGSTSVSNSGKPPFDFKQSDQCKIAELTRQLATANESLAAVTEERDRFKSALEDIVNPIGYLRRTCPTGAKLDGDAAVRFSESVGCIQGIASDGLAGIVKATE